MSVVSTTYTCDEPEIRFGCRMMEKSRTFECLSPKIVEKRVLYIHFYIHSLHFLPVELT